MLANDFAEGGDHDCARNAEVAARFDEVGEAPRFGREVADRVPHPLLSRGDAITDVLASEERGPSPRG